MPEGRDFQEFLVGSGERQAERQRHEPARHRPCLERFPRLPDDRRRRARSRPPRFRYRRPLAKFAAEERLSFRQTLMLLDMQKQIVAHRSAKKKDDLEAVDWRKFYEGVKEFLENE